MTSSPSLYTTGTDHYKGTPKNGMGIACSRNTFCIFEAGIFHEPQDGLLLGPCPCQLRLLLTDLKTQLALNAWAVRRSAFACGDN